MSETFFPVKDDPAAAPENPALPVGSIDRIGVGWWGVLCLIATEAALFGYLLFDYCYYAIQLGTDWIPGGPPSMRYAFPATIVAIASSLAARWGERGVKRGAGGPLVLGLALAFLFGLVFVALDVLDWKAKPFSFNSGVYGSLFFTIAGLHLAHLVAGLIALFFIVFWALLGYFDRVRNAPVLIAAAYWHFVNIVWVVFFIALYISPRLG
jgi:heme/copper-type cytochrome/quinol oxidase subunit 3